MSHCRLVKAALNLQDLQQLYLRKISQILSGITWFAVWKEHCQLVKLFGCAMLILLTTKFTASKILNSLYRFLNFRNSSQESSFIGWKENGLKKPWKRRNQATPQKLLKKILFEVQMMHDKGLLESTAKNGVKNDAPRPKADKICGNHVLSERKRREKLNQRFMILKTLEPSNKMIQ